MAEGHDLIKAASDGDIEKMKELVQGGEDVNVDYFEGWRPCHYAALNGQLKALQWLLENNASLSVKTDEGETVLAIAAEANKSDIVQWLQKENTASWGFLNKISFGIIIGVSVVAVFGFLTLKG